ncbi:hypothetical protein BH20ACT2_BH20ACT2_13710 [soil metagenome]
MTTPRDRRERRASPRALKRIQEPQELRSRQAEQRRARPDGSAKPAGRVSRPLWAVLVSVVAVGVLFLAVYPTRTYLAQRASTDRAEERLAVLDRQNAELDERVADLNTASEIERLAREQYHFVRPGEDAYAVLPPPEPVIDLPERWPFTGVAERLTR